MSEQTSGGVTFADTLGYTKPQFYPITVPTEADVTNKYYVDLTSGSGTLYTQANPGLTLEGLEGKTGMNGGPAYVYVKGSAKFDISGVTINGSSGNEIVIKPWPGETAAVTFPSDGGASASIAQANLISGANVHHLIVDGGPLMLFRFTGTSSTGQNAYTFVIQSNNITIARCRVSQNAGTGPAIGPGVGDLIDIVNFKLINSEIFDVQNDAGAAYGMYEGGGSNCSTGRSTYNDLRILNCIFRDILDNGIQIEPRNDTSIGLYIDGCAIHSLGQSGGDRPGIGIASACGASFTDTFIRNNILFNLSYGGIVTDGGTNMQVVSNTIYDYAQNQTETLQSHGITSTTDGQAMIVRNNAVANSNSNTGVNAYNRTSGWTASNNYSSNVQTDTGTSPQTGAAADTFQSLDSNVSTFLWPKNTGNLYANGWSGAPTPDYLGQSRPLDGAMDIGAIEYGPGPGGSAIAPSILPRSVYTLP